MKRRPITRRRLVTGATIASAAAAVLAFSAYKLGRDKKLSVKAVASTFKDAVKDTKLPQPVSAADVNKLLDGNKQMIKKGRKLSKTLYKNIEKESTGVNKLLVSRGRKIAKIIDKEKEALAQILEDTAHRISKGHDNARK